MTDRELWPVEKVVRGKYYLSQVWKKRDPNHKAALDLETEAKEALEMLLLADKSGKAEEYRDDMPMLFDYLVRVDCRLVTPRRK